MAIRCNMHTHSTYSDGKNTPEEMVLAALEKNFTTLGFSEHGPAKYDPDCAIPDDKVEDYLREIAGLREKYRGEIEIYTGIEYDYYKTAEIPGLDYAIGSAHFMRDGNGQFHVIDYLHELFKEAVDAVGGGSVQHLVECYYGNVADMLKTMRFDILGHVDLIGKLNGDERYFSEKSPWYLRLATQLAENIAAAGCIVELNTGGIARGYKTEPYPSVLLLGLFQQRGIPIIVSSDAHDTENLDFWFEEAEALLRDIGYKSVKVYERGAFRDQPLV